jgi:hypothetical protein
MERPYQFSHACISDTLMPWSVLEAVRGHNLPLVVCEQPEMCLRMRQFHWRIWRLDLEMIRQDAVLTQVNQFLNLARRAGYAVVEGSKMYGKDSQNHGVQTIGRTQLWRLAAPLVLVAAVYSIGRMWLLALITCGQ